MITVVKSHTQCPDSMLTKACNNKKIHCNTHPDIHIHESYYYRDSCIDELYSLYQSKCGYCETRIDAGSVLRVDHYRPKTKVRGLPTHKGYYWLSYEWSNLILACEKCNGKKSDHFPIENEMFRITTPLLDPNGQCVEEYRYSTSGLYLAEQPLLLNPEVDEVEDHLIFKPSGEVFGITNRGIVTIQTLDLNRQALVVARKKVVDEYRSDIRACIDDFIQSRDESHITLSIKRIFAKLSNLNSVANEYSRLGWFMFYKFDLFFVSHLGEKEAQLVSKAFKHFLLNGC